MLSPKPLAVKELYHVFPWVTPFLLLLLCVVVLPTYFGAGRTVRKGALTFLGVGMLSALPAAARLFPPRTVARRLAL